MSDFSWVNSTLEDPERCLATIVFDTSWLRCEGKAGHHGNHKVDVRLDCFPHYVEWGLTP